MSAFSCKFTDSEIWHRYIVNLPQQVPSATRREDAHLMDGDFVEPPQSFRLRHAILDHHGVEVFHVRHADQVIDVGIVSLIAFEVWMRELPLLMRLPESATFSTSAPFA